ncbi:FAD-dependent oxidoreductase [Bailinhaonella thermotolerans]|uniref:FAD-dependent monooxygenase n=1 Tax=Bailinhaonella thermotolerans TaxID=1070861 RepID=A0A3A4A5N1_9ACTN|nr:NAD(P)/FAD-dependent oxidoreductase [Bailinhaonella thermotolerans]RJL23211.1 FAD-dependent monooxygenase [Bailinhaonella thermotolerans]
MRAIVIGGGVGGAASAIALRRVGVEVTIYEAYADPAGPVGSFLSLASNGLRALDALGCLATVQKAGWPVERQRLWAETGKLLGDTPRGRLAGDPLMSVTLMRGQLVKALRAHAVHAGVRIVTGQRLVGAVTQGQTVRAEFDTGLTAEADLLVGADGIWSTTRRILDPGAPEPTYAGLYSASGTASGLTITPGTFNMVFGRNGAFIYLAAPDGSIWWSAQVASPRQPDLDAIDLGLLQRLYRHEQMPSAILATVTEWHRPTLMHVLAEVPTWHSDRIVLVGDAGHPVGAGQGASMAIEDAVVLARALEYSDLPIALGDYAWQRRARIAKMVKSASANRDAKTAGPIARRLRNLFMPLALRHFYERGTSWLYTHDVTAGWRASAGTGR